MVQGLNTSNRNYLLKELPVYCRGSIFVAFPTMMMLSRKGLTLRFNKVTSLLPKIFRVDDVNVSYCHSGAVAISSIELFTVPSMASLRRAYHSSATVMKRRGWNNGIHVDGAKKPIQKKHTNTAQTHIVKTPLSLTNEQSKMKNQTTKNTENGSPMANSWACDLPQKDHYEWFSNCYQMRCDDDYAWHGGYMHGIYEHEATPESLADDFLVFCILAHRNGAVPSDWDWSAFLRLAVQFIPFAFTKSDAKERWGSENIFMGAMGGRSLRFTGTGIYNSPFGASLGPSNDEVTATADILKNKVDVQNQVGGEDSWRLLLDDLKNGSYNNLENPL